MKKKLILSILLISSFCGFSQSQDISKLISDTLNKTSLEIRLTRIATSSSYYKAGDIIKISTMFNLNSDGELINIIVRAPIPDIERLILSKLKNITIPKAILEKIENDHLEKLFGLPIFFQVKSESEIIKILKEEKQRKEREKRKRSRKN